MVLLDESGTKRVKGSIGSIFMHADMVDKCLMALGFVGAVFDGITNRLPMYFTGHMVNTIGSASTMDNDAFQRNINKVALSLSLSLSHQVLYGWQNAVAILYVAAMSWVACFLEGYCWTITGERQTAKLRATYLKAILRQDLGYFDLHETSISEVITSISNDSLIIQDEISEKVPMFVTNVSMFISSYVIAFLLLWKLAIVALPLAMLVIVPSWLCGRSLMGLSRKIRIEYNRAGAFAEQAISSIRTVYAFVGEKTTVAEYSKALNVSAKLGLRQGLVKGLAIGSNGIVFAIWALLSYYSIKLVMYDGIRGGTVYAIGSSIIVGVRSA